jgi:hypothetical protein
MNRNKIFSAFGLALATLFVGCADEIVKPRLGSSDAFVAPVVTSADPGAAEFTADNGEETFEDLLFTPADYGADVSVRYILQADQEEDFSSPVTVKDIQGSGKEGQKSVEILNKDLNTAMLALGLAPGQEATVNVRLFSFITALNSDTLYSNVVQRTATPFRDSECGNYCTIGLIGSATPGGWDVDTDMRLVNPADDKYTWTVTLYLNGGGDNKVKFRASDSWDVNWGGASFPSGTGALGGSDIAIPTSGYYTITFNDQTGAYSFVATGATTFTSIGVIGAQSSWTSDIGDLTKSVADPHIWTGTIALTAGELKFRANDSWDSNWGATAFPSGFGTGGGPNINVPVSGTYFIYFNDVSGEYFFGPEAFATPYTTVGIIGNATAGGWDSDTDLTKNPANPYKYSGKITITDGEAKFRANNAWDVNWGASGFPSGVGAQNGANIPVQAGTYLVAFNSATGEYSFLK